jgi:hypothetical protein
MNVMQLKRIAKNFDEEIDTLLHKDTLQELSIKLELLMTQFATQLLKSIQSSFNGDVDHTKSKLKVAIDTLTSDDVDQSKTLKQHIQKVGDIEDMIPIEGIVFLYKGQHYKFTGQFASANQILNIYRKTRRA